MLSEIKKILIDMRIMVASSTIYAWMDFSLAFLGPYGEQDDQQVFIQKVLPETNQLFIRLSSNGQRFDQSFKNIHR